MKFVDILRPYVRITRVLVTFIAPMVLAMLYLLHKSYRTKGVQNFMRNFRMDRAFVSMSGFSHRGMSDMAVNHDIFWVRLTQVIATMFGY